MTDIKKDIEGIIKENTHLDDIDEVLSEYIDGDSLIEPLVAYIQEREEKIRRKGCLECQKEHETDLFEAVDKAREEVRQEIIESGYEGNTLYCAGAYEAERERIKTQVDQALIKELEGLRAEMEADPHCERYWVYKVSKRLSALKGGKE